MNRQHFIVCLLLVSIIGYLLGLLTSDQIAERHIKRQQEHIANLEKCVFDIGEELGREDIMNKYQLAFIEKEFKVTAYCPCKKCCGKFADGITASGHIIQKGDKFVATPEEFPFNAILNIPGYGVALVLDRGKNIKENCLDVFFPTHEEAVQWGAKNLKVKIYIQGEIR